MLPGHWQSFRRLGPTGIVLAALLGLAFQALGQEQPPEQEQATAAPAIEQSQPQPATIGVTPEQSKKQLKKQAKQQRRASGAASSSGPSMKEVFAGTLAAVVQASGGALLGGVAQLLTGQLVDWFSKKAAPDAVPADQFAAAQDADGTTAEPAPDPAQATHVPSSGLPAGIVAGLAFEVHRLEPDGATLPVDPAVHEFRTGERFVVYFRPSLPGRMDVYNINPAGQQMLIDTQDLAGGQLTRLGPYEFTATTGDEQLRLVMQPCSTPQLVSATRDIVRVPDTMPVQGGMGLQACSQFATRSLRSVPTRDIRKVAVEDGTQFALDALSEEEVASGQVAPREVTLRFRHL
jgi:hypothetical protein